MNKTEDDARWREQILKQPDARNQAAQSVSRRALHRDAPLAVVKVSAWQIKIGARVLKLDEASDNAHPNGQATREGEAEARVKSGRAHVA